MRIPTRRRPLTALAVAAASAASLSLWAAPAGAGADPDEELQSTKFVDVGGVACEIRLYAQRYTTDVYATTQVVTTADQCRTGQVSVIVTFRTQHGDTVNSLSGGTGPTAFAAGSPAVDLVGSRHIVNFANGTNVEYTMTSK
jgi:hypothetical protein